MWDMTTSMEHGRGSLTLYYMYTSFLLLPFFFFSLSHALLLEVMLSSFVQSRGSRCFATKQSRFCPVPSPPPSSSSFPWCKLFLVCVLHDVVVSVHLGAMWPIRIPLLKGIRTMERGFKVTWKVTDPSVVEFDPARTRCTHRHTHARIQKQACHPVCSVESHLKRFLSFV